MSRTTDALEWTWLRDFLSVAEAGSLSGAARTLGVSQPTLTRRMAALEERLRTELFRRTPRGLELTEAGEAILGPARQMQQEAQALELAVSGHDTDLSGGISVTATEGLGIYWLTPVLAEFQAEHPAIEIEVRIDNQAVNLLRREADIALRIGRPRQADLTARKVGELAFGLFASVDYLERFGRPAGEEDMRHHRGVAFDESMRHRGPGGMLERQLTATTVVYRANSTQAQLAAIRAGYGIGGAALFVARGHPEIERVRPDFEAALEMWLVTHAGLRRSARIRAAFDFLAERLTAAREELGAGARAPQP